ncbi:MAG: tyrosine-type recombinase/integrase [Candidatus Krumholzibacteriia bacterium]
MKATESQTNFAVLVQRFFCEYLGNQRNVSPATICSYRDTFRLLFRFSERRLRKPPASLTLSDLDAPQILAFLDHLEQERRNCVRSRNVRLAAIRSFLQYAALQDPTAFASIKRVLAIPLKRFDRRPVDYLSREEVAALINAPDVTTWSGHRDRVMLMTLYNTGARVSEVIGLNTEDFQSGSTATLRIRGKGRKERIVPVWKRTKGELGNWLRRISTPVGCPLFPSRRGERLTRSGVRTRLDASLTIARETCPSLRDRGVSPHLLRHTTAMHLLQSGVDMVVIALWLGHESTATTHAYVEADLTMKTRAIEKITEPARSRARYQPTDRLLAFLNTL